MDRRVERDRGDLNRFVLLFKCISFVELGCIALGSYYIFIQNYDAAIEVCHPAVALLIRLNVSHVAWDTTFLR